MGVIISSVPFWLMFMKGFLFYAFSSIMPCLCLLWHVPVACCVLSLTVLPDVVLNMLVFWQSLWTWYLLHFCHACLNLLCCDLAIDNCSCFVKHLLYITAICFVAMLECSSLVSCCILSAIVMLIIVLRHSCFACHLQTVYPFPVIFISISTEIISSFQRNTWFAKLLPWAFFPFQSMHMHCISYLAYHAMYCIMLLLHCTVIDCCSIACVLALGRVRRWVRDRGTCWVC